MKKLLAIIVLGLLLAGCAKPIGDTSGVTNNQYSYMALTKMEPACWSKEKPVSVSGTLCFTQGMATAYSLGLYSPYYYNF